MASENVLAWCRTCDTETVKPIQGKTIGTIPSWLEGSLIRNGPGMKEVGGVRLNHLFDGSAMLHKFSIRNGNATYQNRFIEGDTYKKIVAADRLVIGDFATVAVPDPCMTIYQRFASTFWNVTSPIIALDNTNINVCMIGDSMYAMTESNIINKIDQETLKSPSNVNLYKTASVNHATAHPHFDDDGTLYNLGLSYPKGKPHYNIFRFPPDKKDGNGKIIKSSLEQGSIVASIPSRWRSYISYFHSFGMSKNYFILVESSLCIDLKKFILFNKIWNQPYSNAYTFFPNEKTLIHLIDRQTGQKLPVIYSSEPFFQFHHINAFEEDGNLIVDMVCFDDPKIIENLMLTNLEAYAAGRKSVMAAVPKRFTLPLKASGDVNVKGKEIAPQLSLEFPRINYDRNGIDYKFFYGSGFINEVEAKKNKDSIALFQQLIKVKPSTGQTWKFTQAGKEISEPIFVADPNGKEEDDGILLASLLDSKNPKKVELLILNAKDMTEMARTVFKAEGSVTTTFHGIFI